MANSILITLLMTLTTLFFFSPAASTNVLYSKSKLLSGQSLTYGDHALVMQPDCNLVLYSNRRPIWQTNTAGKAQNCFAWIEIDGELVVVGLVSGQKRHSAVWRNGVHSAGRRSKYALVLKWDGTLHMYGPAFWSNTGDLDFLNSKTPFQYVDKSSTTSTVDSMLWSGDVAPVGVTIVNNECRLELLDSCNLTLSNTRTGKVLWHTNTKHFLHDCFVNLEGNGEFKIKYLGGDLLWSSGAKGTKYSDYILALRPDGNLLVYGPTIWSTNARVEGIRDGGHAE